MQRVFKISLPRAFWQNPTLKQLPKIYCFIVCVWFSVCSAVGQQTLGDKGISPSWENPFYWQYKGESVMLIGGSKDDNLFQIDSLKSHLDLLQSVGGNYVRCTLSSRDEGNVKPYLKDKGGLYNLKNFDQEYWGRLEQLLILAEERNIIVQIELWATYDFYWGDDRWSNNPFNPLQNVNYGARESKLPEIIEYPAQSKVNPFFLSVPQLMDNTTLLPYQRKFVDQVLSITFKYGNVLYSIDNETNAPHQWGAYWASYVLKKAKEKGKMVFVTEMWDYWDPSNGAIPGVIAQSANLNDWMAKYLNPKLHDEAQFKFTLEDTDNYGFLDVSNNNAQKGETHYKTALWVREAVERSGKPRPINNVKIYGGDKKNVWAGSHEDGKQRFWRNVFAGHAAVRFHRPPSGLGLQEEAQEQIRVLRDLIGKLDFFDLLPSNNLLQNRKDNEAYCLANGNTYMVYFPNKGKVKMTLPKGDYSMAKVSLESGKWSNAVSFFPSKPIQNRQGEPVIIILKRKLVIN